MIGFTPGRRQLTPDEVRLVVDWLTHAFPAEPFNLTEAVDAINTWPANVLNRFVLALAVSMGNPEFAEELKAAIERVKAPQGLNRE